MQLKLFLAMLLVSCSATKQNISYAPSDTHSVLRSNSKEIRILAVDGVRIGSSMNSFLWGIDGDTIALIENGIRVIHVSHKNGIMEATVALEYNFEANKNYELMVRQSTDSKEAFFRIVDLSDTLKNGKNIK